MPACYPLPVEIDPKRKMFPDEVEEGTEQELVSLAANLQPFPPPVLVEAPDQVQEFQASIAQVTTLFTTYNKV